MFCLGATNPHINHFINVRKNPHPLVFIWISSICVEFHPGEGEISWIMIFFHLSAFVRVASQGPCGVTAEALTTAWPPSSPLPRFSPLGEKNSSCNCSSLVCDPLILKHSLNKTPWLFWVVIGANCCRVRAADTVYYCGPFSGGHRITQDQVLVGRTKKKKKEVTSHKSFVQPFLQRKPQRKTDPSLSVSFLNRQPLFYTLLVKKKNTGQ